MYTYRNKIIIFLVALFFVMIGAIYFNPDNFSITINEESKLPNDIRWVTKSSEYKMLCEQVFSEASTYTSKKIRSNKKQAVIMDLDETVLDNSMYQVENFNQGLSFNMDSWAKWVNREEAGLVPGAKKYINLLRTLDIQIVFISNRMNDRVDATKENLKKLGIFSDKDIYLLRLNKEDKKHIRRNEVFKGTNRMKPFGSFEVIAFIGDAKGDFPSKHKGRNFILPNPMYGKW